jgi:hypothetical protein
LKESWDDEEVEGLTNHQEQDVDESEVGFNFGRSFYSGIKINSINNFLY